MAISHATRCFFMSMDHAAREFLTNNLLSVYKMRLGKLKNASKQELFDALSMIDAESTPTGIKLKYHIGSTDQHIIVQFHPNGKPHYATFES